MYNSHLTISHQLLGILNFKRSNDVNLLVFGNFYHKTIKVSSKNNTFNVHFQLFHELKYYLKNKILVNTDSFLRLQAKCVYCDKKNVFLITLLVHYYKRIKHFLKINPTWFDVLNVF